MAEIELEATKREEVGKKLTSLRKQGFIPAVVYGRKVKSQPIQVERKAFEKNILKSAAGRNAIISLKIAGGAKISALTSEIQRNPLNDIILHIDFNAVVMDEAIKTKVPIELTGLPIGVKEGGGIFIHGLREVEVECLPGEIPDRFNVDVSKLNIGDTLHISDLSVQAKVRILTNHTEMIASCAPPAKEEVVEVAIPTPAEVTATAQGPVEGTEESPTTAGKAKGAPAAPAGKAAPAAPAAKEKA